MRSKRSVTPAALLIVITAASLSAQQPTKGTYAKHACALLGSDEIKKVTGRSDVARRTENPEESQFSSNCQYWGAFDITLHVGAQTKVMFGRERDTYAKAPAKLGYKIEPLTGLGDDAYYMTHNGRVEARAMLGETEIAVSLSGSIPPEPDAKKMAASLAKSVLAKLK